MNFLSRLLRLVAMSVVAVAIGWETASAHGPIPTWSDHDSCYGGWVGQEFRLTTKWPIDVEHACDLIEATESPAERSFLVQWLRDKSRAADEETMQITEGWHAGPLPPQTYWWGAVILTNNNPNSGFHFAQFCGDYVYLHPGRRKVTADQVQFWNNSIRLPVVKRN